MSGHNTPASPLNGEILRIGSGARLSRAVIFMGSVHLSGQVPDRALAGVTQQTADVLASIDRLLVEAGTNRTRLVSAQIWLADIRDFSAMNAVWESWLAGAPPPARVCTQAVLADPAYRVEIQVIAAL